MDIDTQIARVKELIAKREEIDAELSAMLGVVPKAKKSQRCSVCNQEGHTARTCPQKPAEYKTGSRAALSELGPERCILELMRIDAYDFSGPRAAGATLGPPSSPTRSSIHLSL
jgi:hypothetical protein